MLLLGACLAVDTCKRANVPRNFSPTLSRHMWDIN